MSARGLSKIQKPQGASDALRSLFLHFGFSAAMMGLLEGVSPGFVFVDDLAQPRTGIASTAEGVYLVGDDQDPEARDAVRITFAHELLNGRSLVKNSTAIYLSVSPEAWAVHLGLLAPRQEIHPTRRHHYLCTSRPSDWRPYVPKGYCVRALDRELLERCDVHDLLAHQLPIGRLWGSVDRLLDQAVGFAALKNGQIVSWCTPDCIGGGRIDFACTTLPDHRRKGLASSVTAASVEAALGRGFAAAGWMCAASNTASWKTAERVGFVRQSSFNEYFFRANPKRQSASR